MGDWLFDITLGLLLLMLAMASLYARTLYASIVLFIAFGLLLALAWARLGAPDLALAEAAIGAGLTGALLLSALAQAGSAQPPASLALQLPATLFCLLVFLLLIKAVLPLPDGPLILPELVKLHLADSGVSHPVTAVLLNFRAWDTLLELLVLLLALMGVRQLYTHERRIPAPWPLLASWSRVLAPLTVLFGAYLLWRGSSAPGGAFQAGALLAAGMVVLRLNHLLPELHWQHWLIRILVNGGALFFLAVAAACHWLGDSFLRYPADWSGTLILAIEIVATLSIAATLTLLVVGETRELQS